MPDRGRWLRTLVAVFTFPRRWLRSWLGVRDDLVVCPVCYATVGEDFSPYHQRWHWQVEPPDGDAPQMKMSESAAEIDATWAVVDLSGRPA